MGTGLLRMQCEQRHDALYCFIAKIGTQADHRLACHERDQHTFIALYTLPTVITIVDCVTVSRGPALTPRGNMHLQGWSTSQNHDRVASTALARRVRLLGGLHHHPVDQLHQEGIFIQSLEMEVDHTLQMVLLGPISRIMAGLFPLPTRLWLQKTRPSWLRGRIVSILLPFPFQLAAAGCVLGLESEQEPPQSGIVSAFFPLFGLLMACIVILPVSCPRLITCPPFHRSKWRQPWLIAFHLLGEHSAFLSAAPKCADMCGTPHALFIGFFLWIALTLLYTLVESGRIFHGREARKLREERAETL